MDADTRSRGAPRTSVVLYVGFQIQFRDLYKGLVSKLVCVGGEAGEGRGRRAAHQEAQRELLVGRRGKLGLPVTTMPPCWALWRNSGGRATLELSMAVAIAEAMVLPYQD